MRSRLLGVLFFVFFVGRRKPPLPRLCATWRLLAAWPRAYPCQLRRHANAHSPHIKREAERNLTVRCVLISVVCVCVQEDLFLFDLMVSFFIELCFFKTPKRNLSTNVG